MIYSARARFEPNLVILSEVRLFVDASLREWNLSPLVENAALVATELAANAVMHARSNFTVELKSTRRGLTIEVGDDNPRRPSLAPQTPEALSGRGLQIVKALSRAWGVRQIPNDGKVVWARLQSDSPDESPTRAIST